MAFKPKNKFVEPNLFKSSFEFIKTPLSKSVTILARY